MFLLLILIQTSAVFAHFKEDFFSIPLVGSQSSLSILVSTLLLFGTALLTTNICNRFRLTESYTNLPGLVIVFLSCMIPSRLDFQIWMPILVLHLFIFNKLLKASLKNHPEPNFFDCAFLLGVSTLFYPPLLFLYPALLFTFYIVQPAKFRYLSISIVGFLMPFLFVFVYLVWVKATYILPIIVRTYWYEMKQLRFGISQHSLVPLLPFFAIILIGIFFSFGRSHLFQVNQKNTLQTSIIYIITAIVVYVVFQTTGIQVQAGLIIPAGFLLTYFFFYQSEQLSNVLLLLLFAFSLVYPWVSV